MDGSKRAGESDIRKIFSLVKEALDKLGKSKFSVSGGVVRHESWNGIGLLRNGSGGSGISFSNIVDGNENLLGVLVYESDGKIHLKGADNKVICEFSLNERKIYDKNTGTLKEIVVADDLKFKPGDSWDVPGDTPFAGYLTNGSNRIYFTIPLPKNCQGRNVTLSGDLTVRSTEGYLINSIDISEFSIHTEIFENLLRFIIEKKDKSKFSENNNIPVAVSLNNNPSIAFS